MFRFEKKSSGSTSSGISFWSILFIVFLTCKLAGIGKIAEWSWVWVLSPLWISLSLLIVVIILYMIFNKY
jgi:hypothetical protein